MRYLTMRTGAGTQACLLEGNDVTPLPYPDVAGVLRDLGDVRRPPKKAGKALDLEQIELAPVVPAPSKIICIGLNYAAHIAEMGRPVPTHPTLFGKFAAALIGGRDQIQLPPTSVSDQVDWEGELVVVIGKHVRSARGAAALDAIAGYSVGNDISMRDWQWRTTQFLAGKTFESSSPVGPVLVTKDELSEDGLGLRLSCSVNGVEMQSAKTDDLVFGPVELVEYISTILTLEPGDLIFSGTPGGVGAGRQPKQFLNDGDVVETTIDGIGTLVNRCAQGAIT